MTETNQLPLLPETVEEPVTITVNLDDLPENAQLFGENPTEAFIQSFSIGQLHDITLMDNGKGGYHVVAGRRRIKAARALGKKTINAKLYTNHTNLQHLITLIENQQRSSNLICDYDAIKTLLGKYSVTDIVQATGLPPNRIKKVMNLQRLHPELLEALRQGKITNTTALAASRLGKTCQNKLVKLYTKTGHLKGSDVHNAISKAADQAIAELDPSLFETKQTATYGQLVEVLTELNQAVAATTKLAKNDQQHSPIVGSPAWQSLTTTNQKAADLLNLAGIKTDLAEVSAAKE
jgi:ParB/RepB/Spo0J family partition protein